MWFGKNIITKVGLALAMAVPALAADVAPLYFENVPADSQQAYWDNLTKYKIWGTTGISVGNEVMLPDESGWIGSATGGITTTGGRQKLGGPIILGGGISLQDGTQFTTGPVRATENFTAGNDNQGHFFAGTICLGGTADNQVKIGINRANNGSLSTLHEGADALTGACAADSVPLTPTKMTIPVVSGSHSYTGDIHVSGTRYIDIPPESETDKGMKDLYLNSLSIANDGKLYIRMPAGGRLTRIFLQTLSFATHPTIQVMYMDESATFTDGEWSGTGTIIANQAYAGNLLFYVPHDIKFENTDNVPVQGTFISTGTITLLCNMKFAGQMLAENMVLGNQIDGSSFIYVPFDPPVIDLADPEARSWGTIYEGIIGPQTLSVSLSKVPTTDVSFKYCFTATGDPANNKDMEENETSTKASESDIDVSNIPICNADGENSTVFETIHFVRGRSIPEESIAITVVNDKIEEWTERFNIRIFGLLGAVLPDNMRSGEFFVDIVDDDKAPQGKDTTFVAVEDADFVFEKFPATTGSGTPLAVYSVKIETMPTKGTLTYFGEALVEGQVIPFDSLGNLIFRALPDDHGADYDSLTYKILNEDDVVAINSSWLKFDVAAVNDAPTVVSDTLKIKENSAAGEIVEGPFTVNDVDDSKFTYAFKSTDPNYDAVNALYTIGADNAGALQIKVKSGAKLDYESADSILTVTVIVTDMASSTNGEGKKSVESEVVIKILDDNEKPKLEDVVFFIDENSTVGDSVGLVKAKDEDIWTEFTYSLLDSTEGVTEIFEINPTTGKITVKKDDALNYEKDSVYYVKVVATDNGEKRGFTNLSDTATVTIKLNDINEDPKFEKVDDEYNIVESTKENPIDSGFVFGKALVFDPDAKDVGALKVTLTDKNKKTGVTSAEDLFDVTVIKHPNADSAKVGYALVVISVKDSAKLDYEALYNASANGVLFDVTLTLTDESGVSVPVDTKIRVDDSNEAPDIQDATFAIKENAPADTLVGALKVTDPDDYTEYFRELVYTIVDENVPFKLDSNKILVNGALNHEDKTTYTFRVAVTDAHEDALTDTATVTITIENENENPDLKCLDDDDNCLGPYKIEENSPTGTTIHKFAVSDVDAGDVVTLAIVDTNGRGADTLFGVKFNDDLTQMEVFVLDSAKLDYENLDPSYVVRLIVTDQGLLADTLVRVINVIDVNEAPSIDDATFSIAENAKVNDEVGKVSAKDPDTKTPAYRELVYTIVDKNVPFRMDSNVVKVNGELNHEVTTTYTFKVAVTDKNDPKLTDTATVTVTIDNVNEQPDIKCVEGDNDCNGPFRIAENSKTGTPIHTFAISDVDAVDQGKLTVTLTDKNGKNAAELFDVSLNSAKTEVTVVVKDSAKLDYEAVDSIYTVILTVIDRDSLTDTLVRVIKVIDVNEKPSIEKVEKEIAENLPNSTVVAEMKASDPDTIHKVEFAQLTYEITTPNMPFGMNGNKVVVTDSSKLDFETNPKFEFYVKVKNCEYNSKGKLVAGAACLEDSAKVVLTLKDMNEKPDIKCIEGDNDCNGPFSIAENSKTGTPIHAFAITDVDAADQGKLTVTITDKNGKNAAELFDVSLNAAKTEVTVVVKDSAKLDYEAVDSIYTVILTVIDRDSLTDTLVRVIKVIDVNEKPSIEKVEKEIAENLPNSTVVAEMKASDPDTIHKVEFAQLTYEITTPNMPFGMNGNKVVVTDSSKLDFETNPKFEFYVKVKNCEYNSKGKLVAGAACLEDSAKVVLTLKDMNEKPDIKCIEGDNDCNGPFSIAENSKTGTPIHAFAITDVDAADQGKLTVTITDKNGKNAAELFDVSLNAAKTEVTVVVKDSAKLDYESVDSIYTVILTVIDRDSLTDTLVRVIKVVDVNEKPTVKDIEKDVDENLKNGTVVAEVEARDPDTIHKTEFAQLTYAITTPDMPFDMNGNKVVVTDSSKLDFETNPKFEFYVKVTNCEYDSKGKLVAGAACLEDSAKVIINLNDVNERPKIIIDDPDDDDDDDDSDSLCVAHCDTTNRGNGDHGKDVLTVGVNENSPKGKVVFEYVVYDEDAGDMESLKPFIEQFSSNVSGKKAEDLFEITKKKVGKNSQGKDKWKIIVSVKDSLNYETLRNATSNTDPNPQFTVRVIVSDQSGNGVELRDTILRVIEVHDVNESPLFDVWPCEIAENNEIGDSIGKIEHPSDIDSMARPENVDFYDNQFKLVGGDTALFDLEYGGPLNIKLVAKVKFDCESEPYKDRCGVKDAFNVVLDYYDKQDTSIKMTKTVPITLIDVNELPEIKTEVIEVVENAKKGTVVDTIKAEDVDVYDTVLTYTLAEDNSKCFDIGKNSGIVTVKTDKCASLDYEKNTELPIKVKVTDTKGGSVSKVIRVKIKDVNEAPNLDNKTITVKEDTPVGTVVDKVVATDPDKAPEYSDLTYKVIGGDTTMFSIDPKTGEVTLKDTLDYELKAHSYKLIVQVDDHEYPDIATLTINIKNVEEWSDVVITKYDNIDSTWNYPDTIYTNQPEGTITWKQDGEIMSVDTTLKKGKNVIVITYKDPTKDYPGKDTIVVMFNDDTPVVTVSAKAVDVKAENVYTIVERTDLAAEDTNIYVNKLKDSIYVTVKDKASKRDTAFAVEISLEPVVVPQTTLNKVSDIAKNTRPVNDIKLSNEATRISLNGDEIKLTYNEVYGKDTVTVSYVTDKKGEPVKVPVVNAKGKIDSLEIITISYKTVINGEEVTISYQAEANTGEVLAKGPSGELMVQGASKKSSSKDGKESSSSSSDVVGKMASEGIFTVVSEKADTLGNSTVVSYAIDEKGVMVKNEEGDIGYAVTYTYVNMYGNAASQSVFIVLDQVGPKVEIITPANGSVVRSNYVTVEWTVNGIKQDTLTLQGLEKGANVIVRFFRDKAGNEASDTVFVVMKDSKDVDLAVEEPVTEITKEKVEEYYAINPPEEGQTFAVSVRNPTTGEEKETLIGGKFETKDGSGKEPYPGVKGSKHLGPTLTMDVKLPVINAVGGLATMDDLVSSDGMIPLEGVDAENATKVTVEQYVEDYCEDGFKLNGDLSQVNMYRSKMHVQIWIYTSLGNFVDYYAFTQDLNDPSYTNEAGLLEMYFEMKPDKDGFVKADNGKLYATGSYLYKVEASIRSELRCTLPPVADPTGKKMGDKVKSGDELLKSFGYKRPPNK